jgi:hypothetical protein
MPNRRYLPSINFSVSFARWSHFYVSIDWTRYTNDNYGNGTENHSTFCRGMGDFAQIPEIGDVQATMAAKCTQ